MRLVKLSCSNCNAQLNIDLDHLQAFCPYCGQKLMIDFDQLGRVLSEKEKTKRAFNKEEEKTKRIQLEHEYQERKEKRDDSVFVKIMIGLGLFIILYVGFFFYLENKEDKEHIRNNEVKITFSAEEVKGENYDEVVKRFDSLGFTNIEFVKDEDLVFGIFLKDGEVEKVSIAGDSSFSNGEWFSQNSEVVITYHSFKE